MEEKAGYFNPKRGIETEFFVIPKLSNQLLQSVLNQRPLSYKGFRFGTVQQVFNSSHTVSIKPENLNDVEYLYKNKLSDIKSIKLNEDTAFRLFKKGGTINSAGLNRVFYLKGPKNIKGLDIAILFDELEDSDESYSIRGYDAFLKIEEYNVIDGFSSLPKSYIYT